MANILKNIFDPGVDQISQNYIIESWHVSQSVDAFTGAKAYDITLSGSYILTGSQYVTGSISASGGTNTIGFYGTSSWAVSSSKAISSSFTLTSSYALQATTSSNALTASYATNAGATPTKYAPSYTAIDSTTYTASINPYVVNNATGKSIVYISQSLSDVLGITLTPTGITDGQIITFIPHYSNNIGLDPSKIAISASISDVYGFNGSSISLMPPTNNALLNTILPLGFAGTLNSFSFQYIGTPIPPYMQPGWYLYNLIKA